MPLNSYQLNILRNLRTEEQNRGLKFITLGTGSGYFSQYDAYRKVTHTETITFFSGSVLLDPFSRKSTTEGGFFQLSDIVIVASRDNRTIATNKDVKVQYENIKFRVNKVTDCPDTNEIVIFASRLE